MSSSNIVWYCKSFNELSGSELYDILQLRTEVFVVEQNCVYQECDGKDQKAWHLAGRLNGELVAYSRILPKGVSYPNSASIGRVVVKQSQRMNQIGIDLMNQSIETIGQLLGKQDITISAQQYLTAFYQKFGFETYGEPYLEDGIPHIGMKKAGN